MDFSTSVQNISWFRDRYREGTLAIKPPFHLNYAQVQPPRALNLLG